MIELNLIYIYEDGNNVINNSEENENEVEGYVALQGNIYYQVLENLFVEEALVILSLNYFIVFVSIYKEQLIVLV